MAEIKDPRVKMDTENSNLVKKLADQTGDDIQEIVRDALNKKATALSVNGLAKSDQQKLETLQKYQEAELNLMIDIFREKSVDSDKMRNDFNSLRQNDQDTISNLNADIKKKKSEIEELTNKVIERDVKIKELEDANAKLNTNSTQLDQALAMLTTLTSGVRPEEAKSSKSKA